MTQADFSPPSPLSPARSWWRTLELWVGAGLGLGLFVLAFAVVTRGLPSPRKAYRNYLRGESLSEVGVRAALLGGVPLGAAALFGLLSAATRGPGYATARCRIPSGLLGLTACLASFLMPALLLLGMWLIECASVLLFFRGGIGPGGP